MGCCCGTPAEPPRELIGRWARDPRGSLRGYNVVRRASYKRTVGGRVGVDLGEPNELLEIPELGQVEIPELGQVEIPGLGQVRHVETFGRGRFDCWCGPAVEWSPSGFEGGGEYTCTAGMSGTLHQVARPQTAGGQPWTPVCGEPIFSIEVNGKTRLYRVEAPF